VDDALASLRSLPYEDLGFAKLDHHRELREGFPEVVLGLGKTPAQVAAIAERISARSGRVLITRVSAEHFAAVAALVPDAVYHADARLITVERERAPRYPGVMVLCAGTADLPVAEEAAITAEMMGNAVERHYDVGVAGIHRLLDRVERLRRASVLVVVAGMEGALPSVVAGLVSTPVIAVPTSIGYGASFGGLAALLGMLNSCAAGVAVVNIDNGFGAGYMAALINRGGRGQGSGVGDGHVGQEVGTRD
jgi:NCAIR mutase (PurE)-related protein